MSKVASQFRRSRLWDAAIVVATLTVAMAVSWRAPGINSYARDVLMRMRGAVNPPDGVVVVAVDEQSIRRFGRFPWSRALMARALDEITEAKPKAIAISLLFSDPTTEADDTALAAAIQRAGKVVVAAQLIETPLRRAEWLRPLPAIEQAAAGLGHGNVLTDFDGVARALTLRETDDEANVLWALAVQTVRVGDGVDASQVRDLPDAVKLGARNIPITVDSPTATLASTSRNAGMETFRASRLTIDYRGPSGTFANQTFSIADVLDGRIGAENFRGKYVLVGVTVAAMGDRVASPFARFASNDGRQNGVLMPGVEVLANAVATILDSRFYRETPDWLAAMMVALVALAVTIALTRTGGKFEWLRQMGALVGLVLLILLASYLAFARWLIVLPTAPVLISLLVAAPLALSRRVWTASAGLDARIAELTRESARLSPLRLREELGIEASRLLPRGADAKAAALAVLQHRLLARAKFVDWALNSVEDGLLIADAEGQIAFANPRAAQILGMTERHLLGSYLFVQLNAAKYGDASMDEDQLKRMAEKTLLRLLVERRPVEQEVTIGLTERRHYILRMAAVETEDNALPIGFVATLSDITKQYELRQMQTDVMSLVTHEMKTPLTAIQGMSEVLMKFEPTPAKRREMSQTINEAAQRMKRMIDEYLDLTQLESGARRPRFGFLRVESLIEQNLLLLGPVAAQREIGLRRVFAADLPPLFADADLLARAITNLVANAIKYSSPNTEVQVSASADSYTIFMSVSDQGYGIPPEHRARIFEKFYRVPRVEDADAPGTGLGLAMVREIAELHGGRVTVESEIGEGTTFTLWLPLKSSEGAPPET